MKQKPHPYTSQQNEFLKANRPQHTLTELTALFNATFGLSMTHSAILARCWKLKINASHNKNKGRFKTGLAPWNKGVTGYTTTSTTKFKPGHEPATTKPIGYERLSKNGIIEIKVAEGRKQFVSKNRIVYEQHHGPIPKGHAVIFIDGDVSNYAIENLALVSRRELAFLNRHEKIRQQPLSLRESIIAVVKLEQTAKDKKGKHHE